MLSQAGKTRWEAKLVRSDDGKKWREVRDGKKRREVRDGKKRREVRDGKKRREVRDGKVGSTMEPFIIQLLS